MVNDFLRFTSLSATGTGIPRPLRANAGPDPQINLEASPQPTIARPPGLTAVTGDCTHPNLTGHTTIADIVYETIAR